MKHPESFTLKRNDDELKVAIYNADEKLLIGLFANRKAAGQFIFGPLKDKATDPIAWIHTAILRKTRILTGSNRLGCNIAVRNATPEQRARLGEHLYLVTDPRYTDYTKDLTVKGMHPDVDHEMRKKAQDKPGNLKGLRYATKDQSSEPTQNPIR